MKRKAASRKLKRTCETCDANFKKGDVYYIKRKVYCGFYEYKDQIIAFEHLICPKCRYKEVKHKERFEKFKANCHHPIIKEIWDYIPGEAVMEPHHDVCLVCKEWVW